MRLPSSPVLLMVGGLGLAGATGVLGATAFTSSSQQAPTKTTTITIPAAAGAEGCPTGSSFQAVVVNSPSGHVEMWVCVAP